MRKKINFDWRAALKMNNLQQAQQKKAETEKRREAARAQRQAQAGFTLIELLIVIGIIGIIAAIAAPNIIRAHHQDQRLLQSAVTWVVPGNVVKIDTYCYTEKFDAVLAELGKDYKILGVNCSFPTVVVVEPKK